MPESNSEAMGSERHSVKSSRVGEREVSLRCGDKASSGVGRERRF
jgi:hypothetical protein